MATPAANLANLEKVSMAFGIRPLLTEVSLGVQAAERIGVVGRNGDGKTTLLRILAGRQPADSGRVTQTRGLQVEMLGQHDLLADPATVSSVVLGDRAEHEWAGDAMARDVVTNLVGDLDLDRSVVGLSGGERRRVSLAALLLSDVDLLLLDEPTNHLDIEAVDWLARHLTSRDLTLVVVTHDRWFLDAVCTTTWEVHDAQVDSYDGGYAAYVLAKAERTRQATSAESRRQNLVRKELAWLRRGAPARTSKPKFRLDAASALIDDQPDPRDRVELQAFAAARLGKDVFDLEDATITRGGRHLIDRATWRVGPGERIGLIGVNGAGKTSVLATLAGDVAPDAGRLRVGRTVRLAHLTQALDDLDPAQRVLESVEEIRRVANVGGREVTVTSMLERFGFTGDKLTARIGDLSGGERRRLQILRLLLDEPNVLLLDEPTNDLDIETLNEVEDFLDGWPGTLIAVSHDRYFLERVCDVVWAVLGDGRVALLPGGVDEYLIRRAATRGVCVSAGSASSGAATMSAQQRQPAGLAAGPSSSDDAISAAAAGSSPAEQRQARKDMARLESQIAKLDRRIAAVHGEMAGVSSDYQRLAVLDAQLLAMRAEHAELETSWLEVAERA